VAVQARATTGMVDGKPDIAATMKSVPELMGAGATDITVNLAAFAATLADAPAALAELGKAFREASR
jgi:hypothetical protein